MSKRRHNTRPIASGLDLVFPIETRFSRPYPGSVGIKNAKAQS